MTSFKTSPTALGIFKPSQMHNLDVFLSDARSGKSVYCILWELTLPPGVLDTQLTENLLDCNFLLLAENEQFYDAFLHS